MDGGPVDGGPVDGGLLAAADGGAGCARPSGLVALDFDVGGVPRHAQLFVPEAIDGPRALVFVFHGLGGDGSQIRSYLSPEAEADGRALFVYPDGVAQAAAGGATAWAETDLALVDALLARISADYCVDSERVFAMGHSYGAYMTNLVGCARGDAVRGIAAVSGGSIGGTCRGPVAAWLAHGTADGTVPESEGLAARDGWLEMNGCTEPTPTSPAPCVRYACTDAPVTWCAFEGGHFPLPSFTRSAIWSFFDGL